MKWMINYLLLIVLLLTISCSMNPSAGGGSDLPDMKIAMGAIYKENSFPAQNTLVKLIPENYNIVEDGPVADSLVDTTDELGNYKFENVYPGTYNIQALHIQERTKAFVSGIAVQEDTTYLPQGTLKEVGALKIFLPDTIDTVNGYVYIEGTTEYKRLSFAVPVAEGGYSITLDSIPEATFTSINYDVLNKPFEPILLSDTVTVLSNDTAVTEAFVFWAHYKKNNSGLPDDEINDLYITSDNIIWVATYRRGIARFDGINWTVFNINNSGLPDNMVYAVTMDENNILWAATMGGVAKYDGSAWTSYTESNSNLPSNLVNFIVSDKKGNIWVGVDIGAAKFDGNTWVSYNVNNSELPSNTVNCIAIDNNDDIWFATYGGAAKFDGISWTIYDSLNSGIASSHNCYVYIDKYGNKWFGHCIGVVSKFDGSNWTIYDGSHSSVLQEGHVFKIVEDSEGTVWIGTMWGLTKFDGNKWTDFIGERYKPVDGKIIYDIEFDNDNNKWIGTCYSGVVAFGPTIK